MAMSSSDLLRPLTQKRQLHVWPNYEWKVFPARKWVWFNPLPQHFETCGCMCVSINACTYMHACLHVCAYTCMLNACKHVSMWACMFVHMRACVQIENLGGKPYGEKAKASTDLCNKTSCLRLQCTHLQFYLLIETSKMLLQSAQTEKIRTIVLPPWTIYESASQQGIS